MIIKIDEEFLTHFEDRLFPCNIARDENEKKQVRLSAGWTDTTKEYEDFDSSNTNSIALRTGSGLTVVDLDTKDLSLLEVYTQELVKKWLRDKATFTVETTNGYHFYFDSEDTSYSNAVRISDYVDVRGDGGCVFCYTEDPKSSYTVICSIEPLPLTQEILRYIALQEKNSKTVEFTYDDTNRKIAISNGYPNRALYSAVGSGDIDDIIRASSKEFILDDFRHGADGLYVNVNKFIYILAINSSVNNDYVDIIVEMLITEKLGYSMDSVETKKRLNQIYSTLIWSNEEELEETEEEVILEEKQQELTISEIPSFTFPPELEKCTLLFDWLMVCEAKTHPVASLTALFTIASAITARGYYTHTKASTSLFMILIAKTGAGKNLVVKAPDKVMRLIGQESKIIASKISSEGAMDDIFKVQNTAIHILDEFGDQLGHMVNDSGGYLKVVAAKIKTLYSLTNGVYQSSRYSSAGGKNKTVKPWATERPCYGLTGITTQAQLLVHLNNNMLHDGFINRFIILNGQNVKPQINKHPVYDFPLELFEHIQSIRMSKMFNPADSEDEVSYHDTSSLNYFANDEYKTIDLTPEALEYYDNFIGDADVEGTDIYRYCLNDETEVKRAVSVRWRENTIRLATALTTFEKLDEISLEVLTWCYSLVKQSSLSFIRLFDDAVESTKYQQLRDKAMSWFKSKDTKWYTLTQLSQYARVFTGITAKQRQELLDDLVDIDFLSSKAHTAVNNKIVLSYKLKAS